MTPKNGYVTNFDSIIQKKLLIQEYLLLSCSVSEAHNSVQFNMAFLLKALFSLPTSVPHLAVTLHSPTNKKVSNVLRGKRKNQTMERTLVYSQHWRKKVKIVSFKLNGQYVHEPPNFWGLYSCVNDCKIWALFWGLLINAIK